MLRTLLFAFIMLILSIDSYSQAFIQSQKIHLNIRMASDQFGKLVAMSGDYAAVYTTYDDEDENGLNHIDGSGSVTVFKRDVNGNWNFHQKIVHADRNQYPAFDGHAFGSGLAMQGNFLVIGAWREAYDVNGLNKMDAAGAIYVYELSNGNFVFKQKLQPSDRGIGDRFGQAIAVSGDYIVAGAIYEAHDLNGANALTNAGAAYIFERDQNGTWAQKQKVVAATRYPNDQFGAAVAISSDGYALVSAPFHDYDANEQNNVGSAGAVFIYERDQNGTWNLLKKQTAPTREYDARFGNSLAINKKTFAIGAVFEDAKNGNNVLKQNCGSVYLYSITNSVVSSANKYNAPDLDDGDSYGSSLGLSDDMFVIGAQGQKEDANNANTLSVAGAAYVYKNDGNGNYNFFQMITPNTRYTFDLIGTNCAVSGTDMIFGAYYNDYDLNEANSLNDAGAAYIFKFDPQTGVADLEANTFNFYPNPAEDIITIDGIKVEALRIYNTLGEEVFVSNIPSQTFDVSALQSGMYFVRVNQQAVLKNPIVVNR